MSTPEEELRFLAGAGLQLPSSSVTPLVYRAEPQLLRIHESPLLPGIPIRESFTKIFAKSEPQGPNFIPTTVNVAVMSKDTVLYPETTIDPWAYDAWCSLWMLCRLLQRHGYLPDDLTDAISTFVARSLERTTAGPEGEMQIRSNRYIFPKLLHELKALVPFKWKPFFDYCLSFEEFPTSMVNSWAGLLTWRVSCLMTCEPAFSAMANMCQEVDEADQRAYELRCQHLFEWYLREQHSITYKIKARHPLPHSENAISHGAFADFS